MCPAVRRGGMMANLSDPERRGTLRGREGLIVVEDGLTPTRLQPNYLM